MNDQPTVCETTTLSGAASGDAQAAAARPVLTRRSLYLRAAAWGAVARATNILVQVVTVGLAVRYLGGERYGMWATLSAVVGWLALANFGLGNGLTTRLSQLTAVGRADVETRAITSAFVLICITAGASLAVAVMVEPLIPWARVFNVVTPLAVSEARGTALVVSFVVLALMPLSLAGAVLAGHQRNDLIQLTNAVATVLGLIALVIGMQLHLGLTALAALLAAPPVLGDLAMLLIARRMGYLRVSLRSFEWGEAWAMLSLGGRFLALQLVVIAVFQSGSLIIAHQRGAANVTGYAVTYRVVMVMNTLFLIAFGPLWPAYGQAIGSGDLGWARRVFHKSVLLLLGMWVPTAIVLGIAGRWIIRIWAGPAAVPSEGLLLMMLLFTFAYGLATVSGTLLNGAGRLGSQLLGGGVMAVLHVPLALWLCKRYGPAGVAASQTVLQLCITVPLQFRDVNRILRGEGRDAAGRCISCSYDLTGNVSGTCPECGTTLVPAMAATTCVTAAAAAVADPTAATAPPESSQGGAPPCTS